MRAQTIIDVTDEPTAEEVALISDPLDEFNVEAAGAYDVNPLAVLVRDATTNRMVGCPIAHISLGMLFVDLFYLPRALRGAGLGSEVLRIAEDEGRRLFLTPG